MGFESQPRANPNERPADGGPPCEKPVFPMSRRSFLKAARTVALGAAVGKYSAHREKRELKKDGAARDLLTRERLQSAVEDLRRHYPAEWTTARILRGVLERSIEYTAGLIAAHERREKSFERGKIGTALGIAGADILPNLPLWRRAWKWIDPAGAERGADKTQHSTYAYPVEMITGALRAYALGHMKRSSVAAVSGGLTALVSELLSAKPATDSEVQKRALAMATETLLPRTSASPELEKVREDVFQYILATAHRVQPWFEKNMTITEPIAIWGIGSYYAASELAAQSERATQSGGTERTAGSGGDNLRG